MILDLTFSAHTFNCVCHYIRSMFRVLGIYNFDIWQKKARNGRTKDNFKGTFISIQTLVCRQITNGLIL